jgi:methyltransferase-like protein
MEQYMDFLRNRMFRQTLLCRAAVPLEHALRAEAVRDFFVAAPVRPVSAQPDVASAQAQEFRDGAGRTLSTSDPLMKAALVELAAQWPLPIRFAELLAAARQRLARHPDAGAADAAHTLGVRLLHAYASGLVEFSLSEPGFVTTRSARPLASPYARLRAHAGGKVTNWRLETVAMGEPTRLVLAHLDGRHDRAALAGLLAAWLARTQPAAAGANERAAAFVEQVLQEFARSALLIG